MTVNELLLELMRLTLEGKGNYKIQIEREYEYEDIYEVNTLDPRETVTLEAYK